MLMEMNILLQLTEGEIDYSNTNIIYLTNVMLKLN